MSAWGPEFLLEQHMALPRLGIHVLLVDFCQPQATPLRGMSPAGVTELPLGRDSGWVSG